MKFLSIGPAQNTIDELAERAEEIILRDGYHSPMLIVNDLICGYVAQIDEMPDTHEKRAVLMMRIGTAIATLCYKVQRVFFITEAYQSSNLNLRPVDDPKHIEVLLVGEYDWNTRKTQVSVYEMNRDESGVLREVRYMEKQAEAENFLMDAFRKGYYR